MGNLHVPYHFSMAALSPPFDVVETAGANKAGSRQKDKPHAGGVGERLSMKKRRKR
jgi:hypothetical protein